MERFTKRQRLRRRAEFVFVQKRGVPVHTRHFVVVATKGSGRLGITVSKKVGNAVIRNRIKRLVREATRRRRWIPSTHDVVVIAKKRAAELAGFAAVASELSRVKARLA